MGVKETIKEVSLDLLIEYGIHGTSTKMITEKADISNGSLFYYFKTKDDIVVALYEDFKQELLETIYMDLQSVSGIRNFYYEYFRSSVHWALKYPKKKMFINMYSNMPAVRACHNYLDEIQLEFVNSFVEKTIVDKDIIAYDSDALVITLLGAIDSAVLYLNTNESADQVDYIDFFFNQFWRSLVNF